MTAEEKLAEVERLAIRAREEGVPLSPVRILGVVTGRVNAETRPVHLGHDLSGG